MKWGQKAIIQGVLSRIPFGYGIHRKLQIVAKTDGLDIEVYYPRKAQFLRRALDHGIDIQGKRFLEIGTGWQPLLPILLHLLGAESVVTTDIRPLLTKVQVVETLRSIKRLCDRLSEDFGVSPEVSQLRIENLISVACEGSSTVGDVLSMAGIDYRVPVDVRQIPCSAAEFDCMISSNVLEFISPPGLRGLFAESKRLLKSCGTHAYHIVPGDPFAWDSRITTINFLKYSPKTWYWIGGSGLAYHNRLRARDYIRMLAAVGFDVYYQDAFVDPAALKALSSGAVKPHACFTSYSPEDLCVSIIDLFARQGTI